MAAKCWRSFLCLFAQEHPDFRLQELLSLASLLKCELKYDPTAYSNRSPFLIIKLQSEHSAKLIASRALLIRSIIELWGWGKDYHELELSVGENVSAKLMEPYTRTDYSFKVLVGGFGGKCSMERQKFVINEKLSFLPFNGNVDLHNPQQVFHVLEDYEGPQAQSDSSKPKSPRRIFFGRLVSHGQRHLIQHYSVKRRHFIGNTSMDAQLSLIMANQAKVKPGTLVYDPFAGTGSLMVACAHFGGYVLGGDIDFNLLNGRGLSSRAGTKYRDHGENVLANLTQYGLERQYIDMLVVDAARCVWKSQEIFDAIVTDPPYGIREGARKIGFKKGPTKTVSPEMEEGHIPAKCTYRLSEIFSDLLEFAARCLVLGGRLVYWLPMLKTEFSLSVLPTHPCLRLVSHSEQPLQRHISRWLITMEKHQIWSSTCSNNEQPHNHQDSGAISSHHGQQLMSEERLTDSLGDLKLHDNFRMKYFNEDKER